MAYPRFIAHRGGGALAPENSLAGLAAAARLGCHGVEFDAMLSADGVPVLMHDDTVDRTTDGHGFVSTLNVAELRELDLGGEPVPLLTEALARCAELGLWANIEIKTTVGCDEARYGRVVGEVLDRHWNRHGVVSSFSVAALQALRSQPWRTDPALLVEALPSGWRETTRDLGAIAVHMEASRSTSADIAAVRAAGLAVACYTVNDRSDAESLLAAGATAIFTDHPEYWLP